MPRGKPGNKKAHTPPAQPGAKGGAGKRQRGGAGSAEDVEEYGRAANKRATAPAPPEEGASPTDRALLLKLLQVQKQQGQQIDALVQAISKGDAGRREMPPVDVQLEAGGSMPPRKLQRYYEISALYFYLFFVFF